MDVTSKRKLLLSNLFSISGLQAANYLLPLITVPYIVRIIGPEKYGLLNYAQAIVTYFTLVINYGFEFTATRAIVTSRNDKEQLSSIFSAVIIAKGLLFFLCTAVFLLSVIFIPKFNDNYYLYVFTYLINIGIVLFPTWFFQGMETLSRTAIFSFIIKAIFTALIFLSLKTENDYLLIPIILSLSQIIVGILAFVYVLHSFHIRFAIPEKKQIMAVLNDGGTIFASMIAVNVYTTSNLVILGSLSNGFRTGLFSASMKLLYVFQSLVLIPISQTFFPHIKQQFSLSRETGIIALRKLAIMVGGLTLFTSIMLYLLAKPLTLLVFGQKFVEASESLRIMSCLPFIIGLGNVFAVQGMLNSNLDKHFLILTGTGALICIALNIALTPILLEKGTAISWVATEIFITTVSYVLLTRNGIKLFDFRSLRTT